MRKILTRYQVDPAFLRVLFSFGDGPHLAESGSNNLSSLQTSDGSHSKAHISIGRCSADEKQDLSYQIRYTEENHRSPESPWSVRQTGVYHHHSATMDFDLFIILNPLVNSAFERQLLAFGAPQSNESELANVCENPYRLHILPWAVYLDSWRWYLRYLGEQFQEKVLSGLSSHKETF